jgi:Inner membrane protein YgaP-like, transmembrane domain
MSLAAFMSGLVGRHARVVAGIVLVALGIGLGGGWLVLVAVGLVAIAAGAVNFCLISPFIGAPFSGRAAHR